MNFSSQINNFIKKANSNTSKFVTGVRVGVADSVINKTPLDTGYARGNWQSSIETPIKTEITRYDTEAGFAPTGGDGIALREAKQVAATEIDKDFYIVNNAEYIQYLEYTGSYLGSEQAPNGMVRITIADYQNIVKDVLKDIK